MFHVQCKILHHGALLDLSFKKKKQQHKSRVTTFRSEYTDQLLKNILRKITPPWFLQSLCIIHDVSVPNLIFS